ncbi:MAG: ABC transporter ATP-binding protein [Lachnospiraceae bacterium]|nr:ABC transporter ATP-binding protein [Lachnospiraceae bacterium]
MDTILQVSSLGFEYQTRQTTVEVIRDLSMTVCRGEFISVVGPSGCGKSTLLDLICGLQKPVSGSVCFEGKAVEGTSTKIGYMLQKDHLFEWRSIERNVMLGPEINRKKRNTQKQAEDFLNKYDLSAFSHSKPSQLSGGMRQRAALIRTMMMHPKLLLLDEPFSALDYQTRLTVCNDIWTILKETEKTAILVTHDLAEAISTGDRVLILSKRPTRIEKEIPFDPEFQRLSPIERRKDPRFNQYFQILWEVFSHDSYQ